MHKMLSKNFVSSKYIERIYLLVYVFFHRISSKAQMLISFFARKRFIVKASLQPTMSEERLEQIPYVQIYDTQRLTYVNKQIRMFGAKA
jgi:hypothetical protein